MPVTKAVMANGSFDIDLRPETPMAITDALDIASYAFSHIVVTPTWLEAHWTDAYTLLGSSIFTGVLFGRTDRLRLSGHHATSWLKDPSGIAQFVEYAGAALVRTFKQWFTGLLPQALGLGSIDDIVPASTMSWVPGKAAVRDDLDEVVDYFRTLTSNPSIEWRVTDALSLDAGTQANLYGETPVAVLTDHFDGPDPVAPGINARLSVTDDVQDYLTRLLYGYEGGGGIGVSTASTPYVDLGGDDVIRTREESDSNTAAANATNVATAILDRYDDYRRHITATSDRYAIFADVPVGQLVWAWDQETGIVDLDNQLVWRGSVISPVETRVMSATMPVEQGMGLYVIHGDATDPEVIDLSRWFVPEDPGARLDLGSQRRNYALR